MAKCFDPVNQGLYLVLAADHRRVQARNPPQGARERALAQHPIALYGLFFALHLDTAEVFRVEEGSDQSVSSLGDLYRARFSGLLHAGGQVDGVTHGGVFDPQVGADLANYNQARVDPYTHVEVHAPASLDLLAIGVGAIDYVERRQHRPPRVVFVPDGGTEEGQDRVAHEAGQSTLVPVHRRDQVLKGAVHDLGPLFRVQLLGGSRRALDVAEQHRYDASLALHSSGGAGGLQLREQLLGNVLMESALRRLRLGPNELMAAPRAEPCLHGEFRSTLGTPRT